MNDLTSYLDFLSIELFTIAGQPITTGQLLLTPIIFLIGVWIVGRLAQLVRRQLIRREMDPDLVHLVTRVLYIIAVAVLAVTALELLNVPLTAFAFVSGAVAIGVGFGAQNIINNFISGWILMWERPIRIGDFLELNDVKGTVEAINTRSTRVRRTDGVHLLIPNSHLLENMVVNWTLVDRLMRTQVRVGVAYGSPVRQVEALIRQAVTEHDAVLEEPPPLVVFEDFGDNALIFDAYLWINATADRDLRVIRSDIRFRIEELFHQAGIVIAFPQRDVHLDGSLTLTRSEQPD